MYIVGHDRVDSQLIVYIVGHGRTCQKLKLNESLHCRSWSFDSQFIVYIVRHGGNDIPEAKSN